MLEKQLSFTKRRPTLISRSKSFTDKGRSQMPQRSMSFSKISPKSLLFSSKSDDSFNYGSEDNSTSSGSQHHNPQKRRSFGRRPSLTRQSSLSSLRSSIRGNSFSGVSLHLDMNQLDTFLMNLFETLMEDPKFDNEYIFDYHGVSTRPDELSGIVEYLQYVLDSDTTLSHDETAEAYTYMGLMRMEQKRYACAVSYLTKVMWIQTAIDCPKVNVALTSSRLGLAYGSLGNYGQGIALLEQALTIYKEANMKGNHRCIVQVSAALVRLRSYQANKKSGVTTKSTEVTPDERVRRLMSVSGSKSTRGLLQMHMIAPSTARVG